MQSRIRFQPSRITLGTAQFGMRYGISNTSGQPTETEAFRILDRAIEFGINTIDTARSYGTAEELIGKWLAHRRPAAIYIVTKVPKVPTGTNAERKSFVRAQIVASKRALGIEPLPLVLAHDASDLLDPAVVEEFHAAVAAGGIEGFGASVYDPAIAERLIRTAPIAALQVPASVADRRFEQSGLFAVAAGHGIATFARSIFLQGVLLMTPEQLPDHLKALMPFLIALADAAEQSNRSIPALLIAALGDVAGVSSLVLGVDTTSQLAIDAQALAAPPIPSAIRKGLDKSASRIPPDILLPTNWKHLGTDI
jgi:aryl-alcohol dehydrogenase-like predicted oxidoreductase